MPKQTERNKPNKAHGLIRIGKEYQAVLPEPFLCLSDKSAYSDEPECSVNSKLLWRPSPVGDLEEATLQQYLGGARDTFKYTEEQALLLLLLNKYNVQKATEDLKNYRPATSPHEDWDLESRITFHLTRNHFDEKRFFTLIKQLLPEKSTESLMEYFYKRTKDHFN